MILYFIRNNQKIGISKCLICLLSKSITLYEIIKHLFWFFPIMFDQKLSDLDICHAVVDIFLGDLQNVFQDSWRGLSNWILFNLSNELFDIFW